MATKFYKCNHCGNVVVKVVDSKVPVVCCGEKMQELVDALNTLGGVANMPENLAEPETATPEILMTEVEVE